MISQVACLQRSLVAQVNFNSLAIDISDGLVRLWCLNDHSLPMNVKPHRNPSKSQHFCETTGLDFGERLCDYIAIRKIAPGLSRIMAKFELSRRDRTTSCSRLQAITC